MNSNQSVNSQYQKELFFSWLSQRHPSIGATAVLDFSNAEEFAYKHGYIGRDDLLTVICSHDAIHRLIKLVQDRFFWRTSKKKQIVSILQCYEQYLQEVWNAEQEKQSAINSSQTSFGDTNTGGGTLIHSSETIAATNVISQYSSDSIANTRNLFPDVTKGVDNSLQYDTNGRGQQPQGKEISRIFALDIGLSTTLPQNAVPTSFNYFGENHIVPEKTWPTFYAEICEILCYDYPDEFMKLVGIDLNLAERIGIDFSHEPAGDKLRIPKMIADGLYVETDYEAADILHNLRFLVDLCNMDSENLIVYCFNSDVGQLSGNSESIEVAPLEAQKEVQPQQVNIDTSQIADHRLDVSNVIQKLGLEYVDKRDSFGAFWIIGGMELSPIILRLRELGFAFSFTKGGGRSSDYRDAWWHNPLGHSNTTIDEGENRKNPKRISDETKSAQTFRATINEHNGSKYALLKQWLISNSNDTVRMSFADVVGLVGELPPSAYKYRAFWSNTNSHPFSVAWREAGYKLVECDLQSEYVRFVRVGEENKNAQSTRRITIKAAMIEYSNTYVGRIKTRKEICDELTAKYGFPTNSILPADYEVSRPNQLPKLFRRVGHGTFECLGGGERNTNSYRSLDAVHLNLNETDRKRARHLVTARFKSGYRISSSIDFERFKSYYANEYGEDFESGSDDLDMLLQSIAVVFDDRAFMYDDETVQSVRTYLGQLDSLCISIDAFIDRFSNELYNSGIFSVDMLKAFIEKNYADIFCKWDYVYLQPDVSPSDLIRQVFDERETWSFDDLYVRLPWLKKDTIRAALNGSDYHRIETGVYTHVDNMDLPDSEGEKVADYVRERLQSKDYVIANELDLSRFEALNPSCPFSAIRDAVFNKFLSNRYDKSGQVITRIGEKLRVLDILEQYCREAETVSFEELNSFEATFDSEGRTHSQCLIAANNVMVRVSEDLFVAKSSVNFNVERTDEAIALYCRDNFITLKNVVDFSLFPYAGYPWNLFLLESYVRKFSRIFKYDVRAANSANIGVIVRKSFAYGEYEDLLAIALAKSTLPLNNVKAAGDYLFDNGYIGWRNLGKSESKILATAKKLREGGAI